MQSTRSASWRTGCHTTESTSFKFCPGDPEGRLTVHKTFNCDSFTILMWHGLCNGIHRYDEGWQFPAKEKQVSSRSVCVHAHQWLGHTWDSFDLPVLTTTTTTEATMSAITSTPAREATTIPASWPVFSEDPPVPSVTARNQNSLVYIS